MGQILKIYKKHNWTQGVYKSEKSRKLHNFKSSWELKLYQFLDSINSVKMWESECIKIPYVYQNRIKNYLPDVLINNKLLVEVKPISQINWPINKAKRIYAQKFCINKGWDYLLLTKENMTPTFLIERIERTYSKNKMLY
jgi:hypothetical protein